MAKTKIGSGQWLISDDGKQQGPYTLDQMKQMITERRMPPNAIVWSPGMDGWKPWNETPEFELMASGGGSAWRSQSTTGVVIDYLVFRRMLAVIFVQIFFWVCVAGGFLGVLGILFDQGFLTFLVSLLVLVPFLVFVRILCEVMIVFYRMNETLTDIKTALEK